MTKMVVQFTGENGNYLIYAASTTDYPSYKKTINHNRDPRSYVRE